MNRHIEESVQLLHFIDTAESSTLYAQRELGYSRIPYSMEKTLYNFVKQGKPEEAKAFYRNMLITSPTLQIHVGRTANDRLQQLKYAAVSAIAIACRAAIEGGAIEAIAYSMSDDTILAIDGKCSALDILKIEIQALIDYATLVQKTKENTLYSPVVKKCIEFLTTHSHQNVSLDDLTACSDLSKEYMAKLFKRETGMSFVDYHLNLRIEEAKNLLKQSKSCSEVAYILGFSTQSYFIRQFKKRTGVTPKQFLTLQDD